ncbi:MAG: hypothetical protein IPG71_01830 [bacterium]|nr:hypothetical protein [bacterium]
MIRTSLIVPLVLFAVLALAPGQSKAFSLFPESPRYFWLGLGGGASKQTEEVSGAFAWNLNLASNDRIITLRNLYSFGAEAHAEDGEFIEAHGVGEWGVLYGYRFRKSIFSGTASAGLAYVSGAVVNDLQVESVNTVGVPVSVQASLQPLPVLGLTAEVYGNLNAADSFGGYMLGLQLGWLWSKPKEE